MMWLEANKGLSVTCLTTQKRSSEVQESPHHTVGEAVGFGDGGGICLEVWIFF